MKRFNSYKVDVYESPQIWLLCKRGERVGYSLTMSLWQALQNAFVYSFSAEYSMLMVNFHLQRHMGNFLIQVYGPCCLLVVLSWVSFWLNREATADRVSLGITTVLTMTFLGLEARTDLPKVPYPTALDFFVFLSFAFIFATILQFAVVHYFTKYGSGECYFIIEEMESDTESEMIDSQAGNRSDMESEFATSTESKIYEVIPLSMCSINIPQRREALKRNRRRSQDQKYAGRRHSFWHGLAECLNWPCLKGNKTTHKARFNNSEDEDDEEQHLRSNEGDNRKSISVLKLPTNKLFTLQTPHHANIWDAGACPTFGVRNWTPDAKANALPNTIQCRKLIAPHA